MPTLIHSPSPTSLRLYYLINIVLYKILQNYKLQVVSFKLIDCNKAHYPKETIQFVTIFSLCCDSPPHYFRVNERRYEFGDERGPGEGWVCSKVPRDGRIMKDCVPKQEAPRWYVHLQENTDHQGCNGGHCYCDDKDGCNVAPPRYHHHHHHTIIMFPSRYSELRCLFLAVTAVTMFRGSA